MYVCTRYRSNTSIDSAGVFIQLTIKYNINLLATVKNILLINVTGILIGKIADICDCDKVNLKMEDIHLIPK